jgi:hypothetical protein
MSAPTNEQAVAELQSLKKDVTRFYRSKAGRAQLAWLDQFEANLMSSAIIESDSVKRISMLDQAKGVRLFRTAYLDTLIDRA